MKKKKQPRHRTQNIARAASEQAHFPRKKYAGTHLEPSIKRVSRAIFARSRRFVPSTELPPTVVALSVYRLGKINELSNTTRDTRQKNK